MSGSKLLTSLLPPRELAQGRARRRIGREERLDGQLGHRDVDRGAEGRHRAEEAQLAPVGGAEDERDEDLAPDAVVVFGIGLDPGSR